MTAYEKVMAARDANKLTSVDYIAHMFGDSFIELHGDRRYADDKAVVAGLAMLFDTPVTVIGIEKGRNTKERVERNFGQAHPEGYRKALRLMKQAEKFRRPVLCLVDTSGAYPGIGAEERGQGQAIAENLMEMMTLKTPVLTVLIGEGGSGGALAVTGLEHVELAILDGELHVLHVLVVLLQAVGDGGELLVHRGHLLMQLGDLARRADTGDDILALGVD